MVTVGTSGEQCVRPNFAMNTNDVDDTAEPDQRRCTAHIVPHKEKGRLPSNLVQGSQLEIPDLCSPQFPPDMLFDAIYAGFGLLHFGAEGMGDSITTKWKHFSPLMGPRRQQT